MRISDWSSDVCSSDLFLYIEHKLYLEAGLNFFYILAGIYGWIFWARHQNANHQTPVTGWIPRYHAIALSSGILLAIALGQIMAQHTASPPPFIDSGLTVFTFITTHIEYGKTAGRER